MTTEVGTSRLWHKYIKYKSARDFYNRRIINVEHLSSENQHVDVVSKGSPPWKAPWVYLGTLIQVFEIQKVINTETTAAKFGDPNESIELRRFHIFLSCFPLKKLAPRAELLIYSQQSLGDALFFIREKTVVHRQGSHGKMQTVFRASHFWATKNIFKYLQTSLSKGGSTLEWIPVA